MYDVSKKYAPARGSRLPRAIIAALATLALLIISKPSSAQSVVSFGSLTPGTMLTDQLESQGVRFAPYARTVTATIIATSAGNVADFNHCEGGIQCEFWFSGARGIFTDQHRFIKVHVGLIPTQATPFETQLSLAAYDANGEEVGSSATNVVAGTGFSTEILITSATANIASFILKETDDPSHSADIGILELEFDPIIVRVPDFILESPQAATVAAGGPAVDVPLTVSRLGGSTGGIVFNAVNLPSNVVATFLPPQTFGSTATMRLSAPTNLSNSTSIVTVIGTPATPHRGWVSALA